MRRTVSARAARQRLGALLDGVQRDGDEVIVERDGKPVAVVVPITRYQALRDAAPTGPEPVWNLVAEFHAANLDRDLPPDEGERFANALVAEVRTARQRELDAAGNADRA